MPVIHALCPPFVLADLARKHSQKRPKLHQGAAVVEERAVRLLEELRRVAARSAAYDVKRKETLVAVARAAAEFDRHSWRLDRVRAHREQISAGGGSAMATGASAV